MKTASALCLALALTSLIGFPEASASGFKPLNKMKATVNGEVITSAEVDTAVAMQIQFWILEHKNDPGLTQEKVNAKVEEFKKQALDDLIDRKLILAEFEKLGGSIKETYVDQAIRDFTRQRFDGNEKKFLTELKKTGMSIRQFRDDQREKITIQALRGQNDGPETLINTPQEIRKQYDEIKGEYASASRLKLRMISIPKQIGADKATADPQMKLVEDIRKQLQNGQDFATMAKTHSSDSSASKGGLVGNGDIDEGYLSPKLTDVAFKLPVGKVSKVIDDGAFWRLMHVDAKIGGVEPPFEDLKDTCDKLVTQGKRKGYVDRWLDKLRHEANIQVFE